MFGRVFNYTFFCDVMNSEHRFIFDLLKPLAVTVYQKINLWDCVKKEKNQNIVINFKKVITLNLIT